ncbi:GNAT family N-acetyltransferase [Roseivirga seohaensis]|uniref:GNAT family N-acetyltransferase n=1 Tax=Roseivirga seohaensis TaxID=1914963 RepID=UPI003BAA8562
MAYKILSKSVYFNGDYSIVPIRFEDRYDIMQWRNEQIYHLRQAEPLTKENQDWYFANVVAKQLDQEQPNQILFSYLKGDECIGYGGLVHINWIDKNAEISFIINTQLEDDFFQFHWKTYLALIERVAFIDLGLKKIFTYAFDLRPKLYSALSESGFHNEVRLKDHCFFDGAFKDVVIHSKFNPFVILKPVEINDVQLTYKWASDKNVRRYSISKNEISYQEHRDWFSSKLTDSNCLYFIAYNANVVIGSFRVDIDLNGVGTISYLLSSEFHGKGLGGELLREGINFVKKDSRIRTLLGKVFKENRVSCLLFEKLAFDLESNESDPLVYKLKIR